MINTKKELREFLEADKLALGLQRLKHPRVFRDEIWKFQILLRKIEYLNSKKQNIFIKILLLYYKIIFYKKSATYNFYIPFNTCDKGLSIAHIGPVIINDYARIGKYCRIHVGVNIGGTLTDSKKAPVIGDNVYIGPGAKIFGDIKIGNNVAIGANAVVNKDVPDNVTVAGVPAKIVSNKGNTRKVGV